MQIVYKKIEELKPYENNPRKNDEAVEYVKNSIKEFGFKVPIVIDEGGVIIAGHTRYKASMELGLNEVPCIIADDLNEEQIKAFRLADNKVSEKAEWDFNMLGEELAELDIDMEQFGFDEIEIDPDELGTNFELNDSEKSNMEQITFTLTTEQMEIVKNAIELGKEEITETFGNENKNGNAIYEVCRQWVEQKM